MKFTTLKSPEELKSWVASGKLDGLVNVPEDVYHAGPGISQSSFKKLVYPNTPADFKLSLSKRSAPTQAQTIGSATHIAILEPNLFDGAVAMSPKFDRRTKKGKEESAAFAEDNKGKLILNEVEYNQCLQMRDSVYSVDETKELFEGNKLLVEHSAYSYAHTGELVRGRADAILVDNKEVIDLKTTIAAWPGSFMKSIVNYGYHIQAAFYLDLFTEASGVSFDKWTWIAVEKHAPYKHMTYTASKELLDVGRSEYQACLDLLWKCKKEDHWPAYTKERQEITLPKWKLNNQENPNEEEVFDVSAFS